MSGSHARLDGCTPSDHVIGRRVDALRVRLWKGIARPRFELSAEALAPMRSYSPLAPAMNLSITPDDPV